MNNAVQTENLCKKFRRVEAVNGLDLQVPEGSIYALVGPNGAGKTTAIKVLMNIFGPSSGLAEVLGMESTKLAGKAFTRIGYVSENQQMPEWMRVDYFFNYLRPFYPAWDRELESSLIKQFDLPLDRKLKHLSRGMKMKAALASSLAYHPELIVLDEPFTGLDPLVRDQLIEGLLERATEATVFISSHDLAEIESFASHVGYLEQGRLKSSEELGTLTDRFREVLVTFDVPPQIPAGLPGTWLHVSVAGGTIQFIDSAFDQEKTQAAIRATLGEARNVTFTPMSLRSIFLAMARSGREA
jgi:ABC-2 type transport system ATP-binding protein